MTRELAKWQRQDLKQSLSDPKAPANMYSQGHIELIFLVANTICLPDHII